MSGSWKPRLTDPEELRSVYDLGTLVFGEGPRASEARWAEQQPVGEADRTFVVDEGDTIVGTGGAYSFDLALPGGRVPMSGVTWIGVLPTHRRRGLLRALMTAVIDQAVERGEPAAGLTASQATIYRRFGFGVAARFKTVTVYTERSDELVDVAAPGRLRMVDDDQAAELFPQVWDQHWPRTPGELRRPPGWWQSMAVDPEADRDGASARYLVLHESPSGDADGFAIYRIKHSGKTTTENDLDLQVVSIAAADEAVEAALLRFLLDVDLVGRLRWETAPVDLPLRWRLADFRALQVSTERDFLWMRPLDVAACLAARSYAGEGGGVVEVVDTWRPETGGRFRLDASPDGAEARRTTDEPDVVVAMPELGSLLLGGVSLSTLRRAGMVDERRVGAVDDLDALFRTTRAPHCATDF